MRWIGLWLVLGVQWAAAATSADGPTLYHAGVEAFRAGDHALARTRFQAALEALPAGDPLVAQSRYNIARALTELQQVCEAQAAFEAYLQAAEGQAAEARRVGKARKGLEGVTVKCAETRPVPPTPPPPPVDDPPETAAQPEQVAPESPAEPTAVGAGTSPISGQAVGGWVALGAGVAGLVAGGVFNAGARDEAEKAGTAKSVFKDSGRTDAEAAGDYNDARDAAASKATTSYVMFGLGVALVGVGGWLLLSDDGPAMSAMATPDQAGLVFSGRW